MRKSTAALKTPPKVKFELKMDLIAGFDQSEKIFQARILEIFEKYNHPFEDDRIVNIEDMTYLTPNGPRPWKTKKQKKESYVNCNETFIIEERSCILDEDQDATQLSQNKVPVDNSETSLFGENEDSDKPQLALYKVGRSTGNMCSSLKHSTVRKEMCSPYGRKGRLTKRCLLSNHAIQNFIVPSPIEASGSVQLKDWSFKDSGEFTKTVCQDESRLSDHEETDYSDTGNTSIADYYPNVIGSLIRLWSRHWKKEAADNIIRYYRRHVWCANKKMLHMKTRKNTFSRSVHSRQMLCPATSEGETITNSQTLDCTFWQNEDLNKSGFVEPREIDTPSLVQGCAPSCVATPATDKTFTWTNRDNMTISLDKTFKHNMNNVTSSLNKPFVPLEENMSISPGKTFICKENNRTVSFDKTWTLTGGDTSVTPGKTFISTRKNRILCPGETFANQQQKKIGEVISSFCKEYFKQFPERTCSPSRRNTFLPVLHSPGKSVSQRNCNVNNRTITLDKTLTDQSQMHIDEVKSLYCKEPTEPFPRMTCTPSRRNAFSELPVLHSPGKSVSKRNCNVNNRTITLDKTSAEQTQVDIDEVTSSYCKEYMKPFPKMTCSPSKRNSFSELLVNSPGKSVSKTNSFSELPVLHSPGKSVSKRNCNVNNRTITLDKTSAEQTQVDIDEVTSSYCKEYMKPFPKMTCSPSKRNSFSELLVNSPGKSVSKTNSFSELPVLHSPGKSVSKRNCNVNNRTITLDKTSAEQTQVDIDEVTSSYCKEYMKPFPKMTCSPSKRNSFSEVLVNSPGKSCKESIEWFPKMACSPSSRSSFSELSAVYSPRKSVSKTNCSMDNGTNCETFFNNNGTVCPSKTFTCKNKMEINEINSSYCKEYLKHNPKMTCILSRRNSFSAFPVVHSLGKGNKSNENFESLRRRLVQDGLFLDTSPNKPRLSAMVSSLVNSPGSLRVKRPASDDVSFSVFKRQKQVAETFIESTSNATFNMMSSSTLSWKETSLCPPLPNTDVSSALPTRMLPYSPASSRSLPQRVSSESPKMCISPQTGQRTNPRAYKKLSYN